MKTCLRICADDYLSIRNHLFPADGLEAIAFALCGRAQAAGRLVFTVHKILTIPYGCCVREENYLHWQTEDVFPIMDEAMNKHMAVMRIHSHPGGWPHFSKADLSTDKEFFGNLMKGWCEDGLPHLSAIMLPDGKIIGRVYYSERRAKPLDSVLVVGEKILSVTPNITSEGSPPDIALRNIQAFGEGTYTTFSHLRIGIVGCSGTGCHVIEQLLRQQVGELVLVDPDRIEGKNLNRLVGTGMEDIGKFKVEFYKKYVERKRLAVKAMDFPNNLFESDQARRVLSTCDVLFGCVDSESGRMLLNQISTFYLIPYIDMGVRLDADGKGGVSYVGGQIDYLIPGHSSLLSRGVITSEGVHAELERLCTPELYEQHQEEHYIRNVIVDRPAVISVNGHLAYLAVLELLERMIGYCSEQTHGQLVVLLHEGGTIPSPESRFMVDDYLAKYKGRGDLQPYLNMPLLSTF